MRTALIVVGVLVVAAAAARVLFITDTQTFRLKAGSMEPTIDIEESFAVNKDAYDDATPQRRDIVVVHPPRGATTGTPRCGVPTGPTRICARPTRRWEEDLTFVKRVVALPGERLGIRDGRAVVDGKPLDEPYANLEACLDDTCTMDGTITVPDGHFFLMGDNRGASDDSRFWGPVPQDRIVGRVDDCWPLGLRCTEDDRTG
jgi:signal peptidase I